MTYKYARYCYHQLTRHTCPQCGAGFLSCSECHPDVTLCALCTPPRNAGGAYADTFKRSAQRDRERQQNTLRLRHDRRSRQQTAHPQPTPAQREAQNAADRRRRANWTDEQRANNRAWRRAWRAEHADDLYLKDKARRWSMTDEQRERRRQQNAAYAETHRAQHAERCRLRRANLSPEQRERERQQARERARKAYALKKTEDPQQRR